MVRAKGFSRVRSAAFAFLALVLVIVGGVATAQPAAAASGAPVVIDDFAGGILGTRTINYLGDSSFSQNSATGKATIVAHSPYADTGGVQLNYAEASPIDLTSNGNNTQFFLSFDSIERTPADDINDAAVIGIQLTDSTGKVGNYSTGIQSVAPENIVLNFACVDGPPCFSPVPNFRSITNIQVTVMQEGNYDSHALTAVLTMIRTTPTGGAVPSPAYPTVTTSTTSVASLNDTTVNFGVAYTVDGSAANEDGLTASDLTVTGTAGGISNVVVTGGPGSYNVAVGPLTSSGTVSVAVKAGAIVDGWGQNGDPSSNEPVVTFLKEVVPTISIAATAAATVGSAFSLAATGTGVPAPTYSISQGTLPAGLSLSSSGTVSGTPSAGAGGVYSLKVKATNAVGNAEAPLALTVNEAAGFSSPATATFSEGDASSFTVHASGYPTPTITTPLGTTLPAGVTLTPNADGTATLSGTPAVGSNGTYTINLVANNGIGVAGSQSLVLTVTSAPVITTPIQDATVAPGDTVTFTAAATSTPSPTVQWQRTNNGGTFVNVPGATSTTYSFTASTADAGHQYRAVFSNGVGQASTTATLTVQKAPSFTSGTSTTFVSGTSGDFAVTTGGFPAPAITIGAHPAWLVLTDNGDGTASLTGTAPATAAGTTVTVTLTATNVASPNATQQVSILIDQAPVVTTNPADTVVTPGSTATLSVAADGYPVPTVQWQVSTDSGAHFSNIAGATSIDLVFTASLGDSGHQFRAVFTNSVTAANTTAATLRVGRAPVFTSPASTIFDVGVANSFTFVTNAAPSATISIASLPGWLNLHDNGDGTATLSGTPTATDTGAQQLQLNATNTFDPDASQQFTFEVDAAPLIVSADSTSFDAGIPGSFDVEANTGYPTSTALSMTGTLPSGLTFWDNGDGSATISGTPDADAGGDYPVTIVATAVGGHALQSSQSFDVVVNQAPAFDSPSGISLLVGDPIDDIVSTAMGFPATTGISMVGNLPAGLSFVDNGDGTADISGTAEAGSGGVYTVTLTAAALGGAGLSSEQLLSITVMERPTITSENTETLDVGTAGSFTVTTSPGFPATTDLTEDGALPDGVSFIDNGNGTATLSGTPTTGAGGDYPIVLTATALGGFPQTQNFDLVVNEAPHISSAPSSTFEIDAASSFTVATSHSYPTPVTLSEVGALPNGITFLDNGDGTATLKGTPTVSGTFALTFSVADATTASDVQSFTLNVATSPLFAGTLDSTFTAGVTSSVTFDTTPGFPTSTSLSVTGSLPAGLTFLDNGDGTATLSGAPTPESVGAYSVTFVASNSASPDTTGGATITVVAADPVALPQSLPPQAAGTIGGVPSQSTEGQSITVTGEGFAPGAPVIIGAYSTPMTLATVTADDAGAFSATIVIPHLLGHHTIVASGVTAFGVAQFLESATEISVPASGLAFTGMSDVGSALFLGFAFLVLGALLLGWVYRRRLSARAPR
ncbi:MAG TPA: putative Ig domain-containing protein [Galbitalea sp.]